MAYLVDANVLCESSKSRPEAAVLEWLADHDAQLHLSALSLGEMLTRQQMETFTFDQTGNWLANSVLSPALDQGRTHSPANEITSISGPSGAVQPVFDATGNMTTMPKPGAWDTPYLVGHRVSQRQMGGGLCVAGRIDTV